MTFPVRMQRRNFTEFPSLGPFRFTANQFSWDVRGGPDLATVTVEAPQTDLWEALNWLRNPITIHDEMGRALWWGYVHEATLDMGGLTYGASLDTMSNSVAVIYTDGKERGTTAYASDSASIGEYGAKQIVLSASDANGAAAEQQRDFELVSRKAPIAVWEQGQPGKLQATLKCRGWYHTLKWRYYILDDGKVHYDVEGDLTQLLSYGALSVGMAFNGTTDLVLAVSGRLDGLAPGDQFRISGSSYNNQTFIVKEIFKRKTEMYNSNALVFTASTRKIHATSGTPLAFLRSDDAFVVINSLYNNRLFTVASIAHGAYGKEIIVNEQLSDETASYTVSLLRSTWVYTDLGLTDENYGARTLTGLAQKIAQSFQFTGTRSVILDSVTISVKHVGDWPYNLVLGVHAADGSGFPGTLLESVTLGIGDVSTDLRNVEFKFTGTTSLSPSTTYWLVLSTLDDVVGTLNYYRVLISEDASYTNGVMRLWNGTAWVTRAVDAEMAFAVYGHRENTTQIEDIVTAVGEFFTGTIVSDLAGLQTNPGRDGTQTAHAEIEALLDQGTSAGKRMLCEVTPNRELRIYAEPDKPEAGDYLLKQGNQLTDRVDGPLPPGVSPVGKWVEIAGAAPGMGRISHVLASSISFVDHAEFDVKRGRYSLRFRSAINKWRVGQMEEG